MKKPEETYLAAISQLLVEHKVIRSQSELNKKNFRDTISEFQEKAGLFVDGIPGKDTLWMLQYPRYINRERLTWVKCDADISSSFNGLPYLYLRSDVSYNYLRLREIVLAAGGILPTSGGKRSLHERLNQHRSSKSMHYVGLAFDISVSSGFFNPDEDPVIVVKNESKKGPYWIVYLRAASGEELELNATYWKSWNSREDLIKKVSGKFINFSKLAINHGFNPISPRPSYLRKNNKQYLSAEWWHFQADSYLIPNFSQFGIELLRIEGYDLDTLKKNEIIWQNRKSIFKKNWF
ncbi:hypothetical protein [Lewinella sp. W8]|uniref:hypothetical protein n=1 Tax=Lewinella sp. W8 TaxID=2528208 RepID=UPI00106852D9|nr:hypothetical protein [Lewinella sp. W8]MTB53924.1 hypothetical protein [Lewinella sp. W8]